jgi:MFS family permease
VTGTTSPQLAFATGPARVTWRSRLLVPVLMLVGMVVSVVSTLGAPLIPTIGEVYHVSLASAQWALTLALLTGAICTPILGRLGDGPHRHRVILIVLAVVVAGCVLAALPIGFSALLVGRALQGVGLGITPLTLATARDHLPPERARSAIALLSVAAVAGIEIGYPLNGVVTESLGLRAGVLVRCRRHRLRAGAGRPRRARQPGPHTAIL